MEDPLLIAPEGIEISSKNGSYKTQKLLIAPEGIEMKAQQGGLARYVLLIAPEGIEMAVQAVRVLFFSTLNRTRRN